ncbi:unnamed protein product [Sphagnum jensenii]|uniref:Uncharacterized protein n=1 Tax=Sphagnum jensenii TaxID=128206 RepID=A0ABP0XGX6_9BRYO
MSAGGKYTSGEDDWFDPDEEFPSEIEAQLEFPMADASQGLIEILQENPDMSKVEYLLQQRRSSSEEKTISEDGNSRTGEVSTLALELYELQALQSALEAKRDSWDETVAVQTIVGTVPNDDPRSLSAQEIQVQQDLQKIQALLQDAGVDTRTGAPAADDHEYSREKSTTIAAADPQQQELHDHPPSVDSGNIYVLAAHEVPAVPAVDLVPSVELGGSSIVTVVQAPELCEKPTISPDIQHDLPAHQEPILMSQYRTHSTTMPSWLVPHTPFAKTPMATYTRVKTRLQDPPHMIPAFAAQVSQLTRHEQQPAGGEPKSKTPLADQIQHPQSLLMQKLKAINLAPGSTTVSPKKILSNKRRSLATILSAPYEVHPIPAPEQEVDPLDDSSIPQYKHWKKIKNLKLHYAQWAALIATCILLIISAHLKQLQDIVWDEIEFWQWLSLGLMAVAGRLISGWCVKLLVILIEYNFLMKKRVLYFIFGLRRAMKNWLWQGLIIATWKAVFRNSTDQKTIPTVTRVLWCTFTASGLWVTKVLMVKILANTFHRSAYFDRIQDSLFHQYVLETISKPMKKLSIAAAKKIKPPAKTPEIPKIQPPNKHLPDVHEAKKLGRIDRPLTPIFSGNKVVSTPTATSKWASVTKSILASKKVPLKASTITKGKKIKTRKEDQPKKASETPVGSVTKSGFHPNSQDASMEPKGGLEEPKVQLHIAEQSNEAGSKQAQPEQPEALNCEASAQQQGHPNSEPTCAPGSEALSHQSSADSDDEDLEDDADLAPMVHQDQLQKLTKDVSSTDPNKQLKQEK